jgi:tetratricopeptide (TPR) repeat protein
LPNFQMSYLILNAVKQLTEERYEFPTATSKQFLDAGDYKQAIRSAKLQLKNNREKAAGWYLSEFGSLKILAQAYFKQQRYEATIQQLTKAIRIRPKEAKLYIIRGNIYRLHLNRVQEAILDFSKGLSLDDTLAQGYLYRSNARLSIKDYQGALDDCQEVLARGHLNAVTYNVKGDVFTELEHYEAAIEEYTNAIKVDPLNGYAYANRSFAHNALKQWSDGLADVSMAFELGCNEANSYNLKALALLGLGCNEESLIAYAKAIELEDGGEPTSSAFFCYIKGVLTFEAGSYQESLKHFSLGLNAMPSVSLSASLLRFRSEVHLQLGDFHSAFADASAAIQLRPKFAKPYFLRGRASAELGEFDLAVYDYSTALQLDASMSEALWYRAEALENCGQRMRAKADFERYDVLQNKDEP